MHNMNTRLVFLVQQPELPKKHEFPQYTFHAEPFDLRPEQIHQWMEHDFEDKDVVFCDGCNRGGLACSRKDICDSPHEHSLLGTTVANVNEISREEWLALLMQPAKCSSSVVPVR